MVMQRLHIMTAIYFISILEYKSSTSQIISIILTAKNLNALLKSAMIINIIKW